MKKLLFLVLALAALPMASQAQDDDLYFNPKAEAKKTAERRERLQREYAAMLATRDSIYAANWSGSKRGVDEYNRGGRFLSHYQNVGIDSLGNDIITFQIGKGVGPDTIYDDGYFAQKYAEQDDDYEYTRNMSRWDGYYNPWFYDYYGYGPYYWRSGYWGWRNPWRYGYYAGWYDPWYDPWFYGYGYYGWYDPWYYGWGGWYGPGYWGRPMIAHAGRPGGRNSAGYAGSRSYRFSGGNNASTRGGYASRGTAGNRRFGSRSDSNNGSYTRSYGGSRSVNSNNSFGSSNFGGFGNRSGGASFGGGGSRGGGSFGGGGGARGGGFGGRR